MIPGRDDRQAIRRAVRCMISTPLLDPASKHRSSMLGKPCCAAPFESAIAQYHHVCDAWAQDFKSKINEHYRINMILDNLPVTVYDLLDEVGAARPRCSMQLVGWLALWR